MRFDDSLDTVLAADITTSFGAQATWRQLVDLIGRGRAEATPGSIKQLRAIRNQVPAGARAASARALVGAQPPMPLVGLFATDEIMIAAPVLRSAQMPADDWIDLLPTMSPAGRSILRHRRDLPPPVVRALGSFGSVDFVLSSPIQEKETPVVVGLSIGAAIPPAPMAPAPTTFVSLSAVALGLPVVAEALRQQNGEQGEAGPVEEAATPAPRESMAAGTGTFQIADLVARIDAYQKRRDGGQAAHAATTEVQNELFTLHTAPARTFRFETDATGIVRWVEGAARAALIGVSLDLAATPAEAQVDGVAGGAFRRRAGFSNARLVVDGSSDAAGQWRITGVPVFDRTSGRFTGYRGSARRPRPDEMAEQQRPAHDSASEALRTLVHELRTPANAIAGFAEMIETEMLGPVDQTYRSYAATIREQASALLGAIEDIDMAARIEAHALDLRPGDVPIAALLSRIADDLSPLLAVRGATLAIETPAETLTITADDRAVERLVARLMATLVSSAGPDERLAVSAIADGDRLVAIAFDRPAALGAYPADRLLSIDAETEVDRDGAPLLGTGFALRLAKNLAVELGGSLTIADNALTLRLPAAFLPEVEQASSN